MTLLTKLERALQQETIVLEREVKFGYPGLGGSECEDDIHTDMTFHVAPRDPLLFLDESAVNDLNHFTERLLREMEIKMPPKTVRPRDFGCVRLFPSSYKDQYQYGSFDAIVKTEVLQQDGKIYGAQIRKIPDRDPQKEVFMLCPEITLYEKNRRENNR